MSDTAIVICVIWISTLGFVGWVFYLAKRYEDSS